MHRLCKKQHLLILTLSIFTIFVYYRSVLFVIGETTIGPIGDANASSWFLNFIHMVINDRNNDFYKIGLNSQRITAFPQGESLVSSADLNQILFRLPLFMLSSMFDSLVLTNVLTIINHLLLFLVVYYAYYAVVNKYWVAYVATLAFSFSHSITKIVENHPIYLTIWLFLPVYFLLFKSDEIKSRKSWTISIVFIVLFATIDIYFMLFLMFFLVTYLVSRILSEKFKLNLRFSSTKIVTNTLILLILINGTLVYFLFSSGTFRERGDFIGFRPRFSHLITYYDFSIDLNRIVKFTGVSMQSQIAGFESVHYMIGAMLTLICLFLLSIIMFPKKSFIMTIYRGLTPHFLFSLVFSSLILIFVILNEFNLAGIYFIDLYKLFFPYARSSSRVLIFLHFFFIYMILFLLSKLFVSTNNSKVLIFSILLLLDVNLSNRFSPNSTEMFGNNIYTYIAKYTSNDSVLAEIFPGETEVPFAAWQIVHQRKLSNSVIDRDVSRPIENALSPGDPQSSCILRSQGVDYLIASAVDRQFLDSLKTNANFQIIGLFQHPDNYAFDSKRLKRLSGRDFFELKDALISVNPGRKQNVYVNLLTGFYPLEYSFYSGVWTSQVVSSFSIMPVNTNVKVKNEQTVYFGVVGLKDITIEIYQKEKKIIKKIVPKNILTEIEFKAEVSEPILLKVDKLYKIEDVIPDSDDSRTVGAFLTSLRTGGC